MHRRRATLHVTRVSLSRKFPPLISERHVWSVTALGGHARVERGSGHACRGAADLIRSSVLRPPSKNFFWHSTEIGSCCFPFGFLIFAGTALLPASSSCCVYFIPFLPAPLSIVTKQEHRREERCTSNETSWTQHMKEARYLEVVRKVGATLERDRAQHRMLCTHKCTERLEPFRCIYYRALPL